MKALKIRTPKVVIITTLIAFMLLMTLGSSTAIFFLSKEAASVHRIVGENDEQQYLYNMNQAATQRILYLHKMLNTDDAFEQDEIYLLYLKQGDLFLQSSEQLKLKLFMENKQKVWKLLFSKMIKLKTIQQKVIDIVLEDTNGTKLYQAKQIFIDQVVPEQDVFLEYLSILLDDIRYEIDVEFELSVAESETSRIIIIAFSLVTILLGILISFWVLRHFLGYERVINIEKNKALRASSKKSQFLANMSHEIRTPLTAIIGFSEAIKNLHSDKNAYVEMTNKITRNGNHLLDLINNILDLSKIEAGELHIEKVTISLFSIIDEVINIISASAEAKGLLFKANLQFPLPTTITIDPVRLKQILINLCSNAIKFTEQGSVIVNVNFDHLKQKLIFKITDTGIGMAASEMNKIFLPFNQADMSTTRKFGGTGLGLNISHRLATKLNGDLRCTSVAGSGSTFTLELQLNNISNKLLVYQKPETAKSSNLIAETREITAPPQLTGSILLAEDNVDNRELISLYISETNAELTVVENGLYAVQECLQKRKQFDLILMDMQMPMMDGIEATAKLRKNNYNNPIVMLTANALKVDVENSINIGANAHLAKPVNLEKFYAMLSRYLKPLENASKNTVASDVVN